MRPIHESSPDLHELVQADKTKDEKQNEMRERYSSALELDIHERPTLIP
jgi:hypothetical protein